MYDTIGLFEVAVWFLLIVTEIGCARSARGEGATTVLCELFKLAGFSMRPGAEFIGLGACFVLRCMFGSVILLPVVGIIVAQLTLSTMALKYFAKSV